MAIAQRIVAVQHFVQVIVKLANIVLTPDKPTYPAGSWHVEGMENERVCGILLNLCRGEPAPCYVDVVCR